MKKNLLLTAFLLSTTMGMAQWPQTVTVGLPRVLDSKLFSEKDVASINSATNWGQGNKTNQYWRVWSDRANNTTYNGPSTSSGEKGYLNFNEEVRIAEIKNDFAHVYVEKQVRPYPAISIPDDKGWVPMKKLLLWSSCPVNEMGIYKKALIVANLDRVGNAAEMFRVFTNPVTKTGVKVATTSINFHFVMKEEGDMVLLATYSNLEGGKTDRVLYGWINSNSFIPWNQRSCLEPNWDKNEVAYFKSRGETINVNEKDDFSGKEILQKPFKFGDITNKELEEPNRYRMPKESLRYPLLDPKKDGNRTNDNVYYCNVFAQNGSLTDAAQYNEKVVNLQNSAVSGVESVNLIIAIDGTKSMQPFYEPVRRAIKDGYSYFEDQNFKVKIGIVIYRDYLDGQYLTEVLPLTKHNDPRIGAFLDNGGDGKYGIKSAPGDDVPEALFEGLMAATDKQKMKFSEKESNLLLVVGDCGNRLNDKKSPTQAAITQRLIDNKFQVVAYQVRRINQPAYNWFQDQMSNIIVNNIKGQIDAMKTTDYKSQVGFQNSSEGGYELKADWAERYYIGSLRYPKLGKDMEVATLATFIQNTLKKYSAAIDAQRDMIFNIGVNTTDSLEASFNEDLLAARVGKEYVDFLKRSNSIMSAKGYTPRTNPDGHDYWKTVIYISAAEFDHLLTQLEGVYKAAQNDEYINREPYVNAFKGIYKAQVPDTSDEELNKMSQEDIMARIVGLNAQTETTKKYTLQQILNPKVVEQQDYETIVAAFASKYKNLQNIRKSYTFTLQVNGLTYFWIPTEMIP